MSRLADPASHGSGPWARDGRYCGPSSVEVSVAAAPEPVGLEKDSGFVGQSATIGVMDGPTIVVAGASGNLGGRITKALVERGAEVRALVRHGWARDKILPRRGLLGEAPYDSNETESVDGALDTCRRVALSRGGFERIDNQGPSQQELFAFDEPMVVGRKNGP